jgi:hypothetical protein
MEMSIKKNSTFRFQFFFPFSFLPFFAIQKSHDLMLRFQKESHSVFAFIVQNLKINRNRFDILTIISLRYSTEFVRMWSHQRLEKSSPSWWFLERGRNKYK